MEDKGRTDPLTRIRETGMRIVRVLHEGDCRYGLTDGGSITLISDEPFAAWEPEDVIPFAEAQLLAPVVPTKIVCVGINYRAHAEEMGHELPAQPVLFLKPPTSLNSPGARIERPEGVERVDYEAELAAVIGRRTHNASRAEAKANIVGFTCANDVTARDVQKVDGQWTRAKGYDGFCPVGPWVETDIDPTNLTIEAFVDGERRQSSNTQDMIFDVYDLVSFASRVMTLVPGDLVLTGTPSGIGPMEPGQSVEVRIQGIGSLVNHMA